MTKVMFSLYNTCSFVDYLKLTKIHYMKRLFISDYFDAEFILVRIIRLQRQIHRVIQKY